MKQAEKIKNSHEKCERTLKSWKLRDENDHIKSIILSETYIIPQARASQRNLDNFAIFVIKDYIK